MMEKKRFFWMGITLIFVFASIVFINFIDKSIENRKIVVSMDKNKKTAYKIVYAPLRWIDISSFVDIVSKSNMCNEYIKKGVINLKYKYKEKIYAINNRGSFELDTKFKYNEPIKVILEAKKDIEKCEFDIFTYSGKFNMLLTGIIFYWLPFFLVLINILLPIMKNFTAQSSGGPKA